MRPILYEHRLAALAEGDCVVFTDHLEALEPDHPVRRFVSAMCLFSCEADAARSRLAYSTEGALLYARALLMPAALFDGLDRELEDHLLAEEFNVPLEQIELRREDLLAQGPAGG